MSDKKKSLTFSVKSSLVVGAASVASLGAAGCGLFGGTVNPVPPEPTVNPVPDTQRADTGVDADAGSTDEDVGDTAGDTEPNGADDGGDADAGDAEINDPGLTDADSGPNVDVTVNPVPDTQGTDGG